MAMYDLFTLRGKNPPVHHTLSALALIHTHRFHPPPPQSLLKPSPWAQHRPRPFAGFGTLPPVLHPSTHQLVRDHHIQEEDEHGGIHSAWPLCGWPGPCRYPGAKNTTIHRLRGSAVSCFADGLKTDTDEATPAVLSAEVASVSSPTLISQVASCDARSHPTHDAVIHADSPVNTWLFI